MRFSITKKNTVQNSTEWFRFAPPKGEDKQWKKGRSAFELAEFATSSDFKVLIESILKEVGLNSNQTFECEPEAETQFPVDKMGTSGPRNHDLLMIGDDCVIGIEAKVSESFDKTIAEKRKDASKNMRKRLDGSIKYIFGNNQPTDVEDLRYQLFSATIGTIEEVKKAKKNKNTIQTAIILVLVFTGDVDKESNYQKKITKNNTDYENFCKVLSVNPKGGYINVADAEGIKCYLKKVEIEIPKSKYNILWQ